jgi:Ni/Fe-hydrogenase subunit HybB-like protein
MKMIQKLCIGLSAAALGINIAAVLGVNLADVGMLIYSNDFASVGFSNIVKIIMFSALLYLSLYRWDLVGPK